MQVGIFWHAVSSEVGRQMLEKERLTEINHNFNVLKPVNHQSGGQPCVMGYLYQDFYL